MWIKKSEYKELQKYKRITEELEKECKRLAEQITSQTEDCKIGIWCKECKHRGIDWSDGVEYDFLFGWMKKDEWGNVQYCKKHIHETCPEFEMNEKKG